MSRILEAVAVAVLSFLFSTFILPLLGAYIGERGTISISETVALEGGAVKIVTVSNYGTSFLDDLVFSVPASARISAIQSTSPVKVTEITDLVLGALEKRVSISRIEPSRVTALVFELADGAGLIRPINATDKKLGMEFGSNLERPYIRAVKSALVASLISSIGAGLILFWALGKYDQLQTRLESLMHRIEDTKKRHDADFANLQERTSGELSKTTRELTEAQRMIARYRLLLIYRLTHFEKEIGFWRDTIRKILVGKGTADPETVLTTVTSNLRTWQTWSSTDKAMSTTDDLRRFMEDVDPRALHGVKDTGENPAQ